MSADPAFGICLIPVLLFGGGLFALWVVTELFEGGSSLSLPALGRETGRGSLPRVSKSESRRAYERWKAQIAAPVHFGPVLARYLGPTPDALFPVPEKGAIGVTVDDIIFVGMDSADFQVRIPFDEVRWISGDATALYTERDGLWQMHMMSVGAWGRFVEVVQMVSPARVTVYEPLNLVSARHLEQDMLGQWTTGNTVRLFLAPDRLLEDWRTAMLFAHIRGITLIADIAGFRRSSLLRLEIEEPDHPRHVIGYALSEEIAQGWAQKLGLLTGLEVDVQSGRKKKDDDDLDDEI